ncbi:MULTISPECIES: DUF6850 family outer membrane beta-barrel protein [unclassified Myroides]|uniref:DUF6850 family outer membrane beta-barrel protein n=1 Tax=unclassified Myroides TaxID=2642485 RepID=UPI00310178BA
MLSVIPYYALKEIKESTFDSKKYRNFKYGIFGLQGRYVKKFNPKDVVTFSADMQKREVNKTNYSLGNSDITPSIKQWLDSDYAIYNSAYLNYSASVRYDQKLSPKIGGYLKLDYNNLQYKSQKSNTYIGFTTGITF